MALPKQVKKQLEEIEEIEKQLQAPVEETAVVPEEDGQTTGETLETVEQLEAHTPTQPKEQKVQEDAWEHKYHRLQGKYDAEVPRLHAQVKELSGYIDQLRTQMEQKQEQPQPKVAERLVTDAEIDEYGEELVDLQRRIVREEIRGELEAIKSENEHLKNMLMQTGFQVGEVTFEQRLHRLVPDFDQINADPQWVAWLDTVDPILRAPRRVLAQDAFTKGDAEAVAHYVKLFRGETEQQPEQQGKSAKRAELERQVQPTRATTKAPTSKTGKTYSRSDVEKMFQKVAMLGSQQKHDEAKKLEAEIDAAFREGRVAL